jgi:AbrB family looped-hinge helix DNA binding protein
MTYTAMPSVKGQITIPSQIREKYNIGKTTPVVIEDIGKGIITIKIMKMVDHDAIEYYENDEEFGLNFKKPIDPSVLIDAIKKIDG